MKVCVCFLLFSLCLFYHSWEDRKGPIRMNPQSGLNAKALLSKTFVCEEQDEVPKGSVVLFQPSISSSGNQNHKIPPTSRMKDCSVEILGFPLFFYIFNHESNDS